MVQEVCELKRGLQKVKLMILEKKKKISRPLIIGIAGGTCSGKTEKVAIKIQAMFSNSKIIHMDDYCRGRNFMCKINSNWDEPRIIDLERLKRDLKNLRREREIKKPIYSLKTSEREGYEIFGPSEIIIVEGLFVLHEPVIGELDIKIFVETSIHGSLIRRLIRDIKRTGQNEGEIFKQFTEIVCPMYKIHVEPKRSKADVVIINHYVLEIESECCDKKEIQIRSFLNKIIADKDLEVLGFKNIVLVNQKDTYYTTPSWKSPYTKEIMRIREENGKTILTYKGSTIRDSFEVRPKIQFEIGPSLKDALLSLGYKKKLVIVKERKLFIKDSIEISLDKTKKDGSFIEFRTTDIAYKKQIKRYLKELGISPKLITKKPLIQLVLESRRARKGSIFIHKILFAYF